MTADQLAQIFTQAGFTAEMLSAMLGRLALLDKREALQSAIRAEDSAQQAAVQASEAKKQMLQAELADINAQLEATAP